jgi:hypothetical protein
MDGIILIAIALVLANFAKRLGAPPAQELSEAVVKLNETCYRDDNAFMRVFTKITKGR